MSEFLFRPIKPSDIKYATNSVNDIAFIHNSSYGFIDLKVNYTTTETNETPFFLFDKTIKAININKLSSVNNLLVYEASTTNTKDHKLHPKINPVIQVDDMCNDCEKLGRD